MTPSPLVALLFIMDPAGRYAEHKPVKAFNDATSSTTRAPTLSPKLSSGWQPRCRLSGVRQVETRLVSGQMANTAVFSALVDYLNRADRKM